MELDLVDLEAEILKATSSFLVLRLNFSGLRTNSTFEIFEEDFHKSLNIDMAKLMCRYRQELKDYYQIYVFIDEYDARMTEVLKNGSTLKPLIVHHKNSLSRTEAMESSFKQFYIRLKSACDNGIAYVFQTGVTPIVMSEFTSGFNISTDLALREEFWDLYGALVNFKELLNAIELSGHKIYVFIDEYDARMTEVLKNGSTLKPLIVHHKNSLSRTEAMESSFKQFYIRLKSACDNGIAYVFQTGVTPIVMSEFTSGFNISTDLALREEFWDLYGFKKVRSIFNTGSILYSTRMLTGRIKYVERYKDTSIYIKKLLQFSPDPHTLPSQTTMNLIVNNSLGKPILTESIGQLSLESRNGIEQRF
ncbi:12268_t:CDS:2 [Entrophospora sp. SA101]|nr:12268_t:CDS:2 [Entrophospora sp. SA101]